jgi:hypothetical protein
MIYEVTILTNVGQPDPSQKDLTKDTIREQP